MNWQNYLRRAADSRNGPWPTADGLTLAVGDNVFEVLPVSGAFMLIRQSGSDEAFVGSMPIGYSGVVLSEELSEISVRTSAGDRLTAVVPEEFLPAPPGQSILELEITNTQELGRWEFRQDTGRVAGVWVDRPLLGDAAAEVGAILSDALTHVSPGPATGLVCDELVRKIHLADRKRS